MSLFIVASGRAPAAEPGDSIQLARQALEQTRQTQHEILGSLSGLAAGRQQASSIGELLNTLSTVHQMQTAVVRSTRALVPRTFGQAASKLAQEDRQAIDQLAGDQRAVRQRLTDWTAVFMQIAGSPAGVDTLHAVAARVTACPAGEQMEQAVRQIGDNRLAEASTTGQQAADELARLLQALEVATVDPADLRDQRLRLIREIIQQEKAVRDKLDPAPAGAVEWRRLQREQSDISERLRPLTFDETALSPEALNLLRQGHEAMRAGESSMRGQQATASIQSIDKAVAVLTESIALIESAGGEKDADLPAIPLTKQKPGKPIVGGAAFGGGAAASGEENPIGQVAADIALVVKLRRQQRELYEETTQKRPAKPGLAERQTSYAGQLPQLIRRVEAYLAPAAADLEPARQAMVEAAGALRSDDRKQAASRQQAALEKLAAAEAKMRAFWKELFEAMARISALGSAGPSQGAAPQGSPNKVDMNLLLAMLREVVRVGQLMKDQDDLIATTKGWAEGTAGKPETSAVSETGKKQRELGATAHDIYDKLQFVAGQVQALPEALTQSAEFMDGAADALDASKFGRALERQQAAIEFLENAWTVMAMSVASMTQSEQAGQSEADNKTGEAKVGAGQNTAGSDSSADGGKPWYFDLPPQARDAVSQSMDEAFPAQYAPAIKRYYERLSKQHGGSGAK